MLTISKEDLMKALDSGSISCSYTDKETGERINFMVATKEEAEEADRIGAMADRLEKGENLTDEFRKELADEIRSLRHDRDCWRGRMKYVLKQREKGMSEAAKEAEDQK